jgi:chloramphenicol O-acetyltransferase
MDSAGYIDEVKRFKGLSSDYKVAKLFGWTPNRITKYREGQTMDNEACRQVAEVLEIRPMQVIADMEAMRQSDHEKKQAWIELAKLTREAGSVVIPLLLIMPILFGSATLLQKSNVFQDVTSYILCELKEVLE